MNSTVRSVQFLDLKMVKWKKIKCIRIPVTVKINEEEFVRWYYAYSTLKIWYSAT